jgi:hypothetical protein
VRHFTHGHSPRFKHDKTGTVRCRFGEALFIARLDVRSARVALGGRRLCRRLQQVRGFAEELDREFDLAGNLRLRVCLRRHKTESLALIKARVRRIGVLVPLACRPRRTFLHRTVTHRRTDGTRATRPKLDIRGGRSPRQTRASSLNSIGYQAHR